MRQAPDAGVVLIAAYSVTVVLVLTALLVTGFL